MLHLILNAYDQTCISIYQSYQYLHVKSSSSRKLEGNLY